MKLITLSKRNFLPCLVTFHKLSHLNKQSFLLHFLLGYKEVNTSLPCDVGSIRNSSFGSGCCKLIYFACCEVLKMLIQIRNIYTQVFTSVSGFGPRTTHNSSIRSDDGLMLEKFSFRIRSQYINYVGLEIFSQASHYFLHIVTDECPPGTYDKNGACEACAEGTFQDKTGQTDCKACPSGTQSGKGAYKCRRE